MSRLLNMIDVESLGEESKPAGSSSSSTSIPLDEHGIPLVFSAAGHAGCSLMEVAVTSSEEDAEDMPEYLDIRDGELGECFVVDPAPPAWRGQRDAAVSSKRPEKPAKKKPAAAAAAGSEGIAKKPAAAAPTAATDSKGIEAKTLGKLYMVKASDRSYIMHNNASTDGKPKFVMEVHGRHSPDRRQICQRLMKVIAEHDYHEKADLRAARAELLDDL